MRVQGGLKPDDWRRWGQFTTFKSNAAELLRGQKNNGRRIYCSPLVDPYQPAEESRRLMPGILEALMQSPPEVFALQTRGPLIKRDIPLLAELARYTIVRVSFSLTTDREEVRRWYEPHCATLEERAGAMRELRDAGIGVFPTLAPLLPCDPENLARIAVEAGNRDVICDPFHTRLTKPAGATTHAPAVRISEVRGLAEWHEPEFQARMAARAGKIVELAGRRFGVGPQAFAWLSTPHII